MRAQRFLERRSRKLRRGVTLVEVAIVLGIIGVMLAVAAPSMSRWQDDQRAKAAARDVADLLMLARGEAVRTGDQHVVYFGAPGYTDPAGTAVVGPAGTYVPMLVLNDGPPATANCRIDGGEASESFPPADGLNWGVSLAPTRAPDDTGAAAFAPPQASGSRRFPQTSRLGNFWRSSRSTSRSPPRRTWLSERRRRPRPSTRVRRTP